jgi:hypothetical protein
MTKKKIKNLSPKEKEKRQVYAIASGCQVHFSSSYADRKGENYRLDSTPQGFYHAWIAAAAKEGEWIEICSESPRFWTKITVQGRGDYDQWVTLIKVKSSLNGQ